MPTFIVETTSTDRRFYRVKAESKGAAREIIEGDEGDLDPYNEIWGDPEIVRISEAS